MTTDTSNASSAYKAHTNLEAVRECPFCGDETLSRGLFVHVFNSSDEEHGPRGEVPDGFSVSEAEVVGHREVEMNNPTKYNVDHHRYVCDYCGSPFKGKLGLQVHLDRKAGKDAVHPREATDREMDTFETFPATEDGKIIVESSAEADALPEDADIVLAERVPDEQEETEPMVPISELKRLRERFLKDADGDVEVTAYHAAERIESLIEQYD